MDIRILHQNSLRLKKLRGIDMKKYLLMALLIILASCTGSTGNSNSPEKWRSGTDALKFNFVSDNPPSEVLSTQKLNIMAEFSNKGAESIPAGGLVFYLTGYDKSILFGNDLMYLKSNELLEGKSQYNPQGSQSSFGKWETRINTAQLPRIDSFKQDFTLTACYKYKTVATPEVCVDPEKYDSAVAGKCNFEVRNLGSSQGAPVSVSQVNLRTTSDTAYFEIHFKNNAKGKDDVPYLPSKGLDNCYTSLGIQDVNMIQISKVSLSGIDFTNSCKPSRQVRLVNGQGFVACERPISGSYFTGVMNIELDYNYRQSISKQISIVNVNR